MSEIISNGRKLTGNQSKYMTCLLNRYLMYCITFCLTGKIITLKNITCLFNVLSFPCTKVLYARLKWLECWTRWTWPPRHLSPKSGVSFPSAWSHGVIWPLGVNSAFLYSIQMCDLQFFTKLVRRHMPEILPIRRLTLYNQSINQNG